MKRKMAIIAAAGCAIAACAVWAGDGPWEAPQKKLIASGWDLGRSMIEEVAEHADLFDQTGVDGVVFHFPYVTDAKGKKIYVTNTMVSPDLTEANVGKYVPILKKLTSEHKAFKHSFIGCNWTPSCSPRLSWTNDVAWAQAVANTKVLASLAKRGGAVGICADGEDYGTSQYWLQTYEPPFDVTGPIARERGRQIGRAIFDAFPEAKVISFWFLSLNKSYAHSADPAGAMRADGDLWPMFVNGLLDVMPPTARLIDGDEHGYWYKTGFFDYERENVRMKTRDLALIAPENRAKYRAQVMVGFGLYLDEYVNPKKVSYRTKNGSAVEAFREQLGEALYAADEYVWFWGEKHRWVAWKDLKIPWAWMKIDKQTWEERLPGLAQVMREAKDPRLEIANAVARLRAAGATNRVEKSLLAKGSNWQDGKTSHGTFTPMPGRGHDGTTAVLAENVSNGCWMFSVAGGVKESETYVIEAYARGGGVKALTVRWSTPNGWSWNTEGVDEPFASEGDGVWRRALAKVRVPRDMTGMTLKINLAQQPGEKAAIDRVTVYRVN